MARTHILVLALAAGCVGSEGDTGSDKLGDGGGNGGASEDAYGCVEVSREAVGDTSAPADGFSFAADTVLGSAVGAFTGTAVFRDGTGTELPPVAASWTVGAPDTVWAVYREFNDWSGDTGTLESGAPWPENCDPYYEGEVALALSTDGGELAESMAGGLSIFDDKGASTGGDIDVAALAGTLRPDFDPTEYDTATLSIWASTTAGGWQGDMQLSASRELGGGVAEGIVGPAGGFEVAATR